MNFIVWAVVAVAARARSALVRARADDLRRRRQPDRLPAGRRAGVAGAAGRLRASAGLFAAVGGLLFSGTTGSVGVDQTNAYLLPSVAATVIGGTSILGGTGGYSGTILGALILTVLNRLLLRLDVSEAFRQMLYGADRAGPGVAVRPPDRPEGIVTMPHRVRARRDRDRDHGGGAHRGAAAARARRRRHRRLLTRSGRGPRRRRTPLPPVYDSVDALLADPSVEVVHVTSPNHLHAEQVRATMAAGKHVVCEKPLGVSSTETADLLALAEAGRRRPRRLLQHPLLPAEPERRGPGRRRADRRAALRHRPLPPGLAAAGDGLELAPGRRRGRAPCGPWPTSASHWLDLTRFITGRDVVEVLRRPAHVRHERNHPVGEVETFAAAAVADDVERVREHDGERRRRRAAAALRGRPARHVLGQPGVGGPQEHRRVGVDGSAPPRWRGRPRSPEHLWIGHRGRPNEVLEKDAALMTPAGVAAAAYPAGHVEGYPDTFRGLFAAVYRDIEAGGPADRPTYPTFADGHDAVVGVRGHRRVRPQRRRGRRSSGVDRGGAHDEARPPHRRLPRHARSTEVADWAAANGFSVLEVACWPRGRRARRAATPACPTSTAPTSATTRPRSWSADWPSGASRSPAWATTRTRCHPDLDHRAEVIAHLRPRDRGGSPAGRPGGQHVHRQRQGQDRTGELRGVHQGLARHGAPTPPTRRQDRHRELPDDLHRRRVAGRPEPDVHAGHVAGRVRLPRRRHARPQPRPPPPGLADDRLRAGGARVRQPHLPRARQGHGDRPGRPLRARRAVGRDGLAGAPPPWPGPGSVGPLPRRAVPGRLRPRQ